MDAKSRKALSWSLSVLVHVTLLFFIIRAGIHYALPEGEVQTGQSIDVVEATGGVPAEPTDKSVPAPQAAKPENEAPAPKIKMQTKSVAPQDTSTADETADADAPTQFIPDKEPQDVIPEDKEKEAPAPETSDETSETQTAPEAPDQQKDQQKDQSQEDLQPVPTQQTQQEETPPQPAPAPPAQEAQQAEPAPAPETQQSQVAANPPPSTNEQNRSQQMGAGGPGTNPNANGTSNMPPNGPPGPILDETKLVEIPGNRKPNYPWLAKLRRQEGTVILRAFIKTDGHVDLPSLVKSSGHPLLDQECLKAYAQWRYRPGPSGWVLKPFRFILKGN